MIVVCAGLDLDLLERGHLPIARGPDDPHVGRTVVQHAHEVFGIVGVLQAIGVGQLDAIGVVGGDHQIAGEGPVGLTRQRNDASGSERHGAGQDWRGGRVRPDRQVYAGAGGRIDVAAVLLAAVRELGEAWELVGQINPCHARERQQRHGVIGRTSPCELDAIDERCRDARKARGKALVPLGGHPGAAHGLLHADFELRRETLPGGGRAHANRERRGWTQPNVAGLDVEHQ